MPKKSTISCAKTFSLGGQFAEWREMTVRQKAVMSSVKISQGGRSKMSYAPSSSFLPVIFSYISTMKRFASRLRRPPFSLVPCLNFGSVVACWKAFSICCLLICWDSSSR